MYCIIFFYYSMLLYVLLRGRVFPAPTMSSTQRVELNRAGLFEGVCVTAVILAPGACGTGGPTRGSCHHFAGSCGSGGSRGIRNEFQIVRKPDIFTVKTSPDSP